MRWLLIRRSPADERLIYYQAYGKTGTTLLELAQVAPVCSIVSRELALAKSTVGLADYEARRYEAWYRHVTLSLFAHALLRNAVATASWTSPPQERRLPRYMPST